MSERDTWIRLRACELMEATTGMPSYMVDDETCEAAYVQADHEYIAPRPLSPLQEAIRKASGQQPTATEIEDSIAFLNKAATVLRGGAQ